MKAKGDNLLIVFILIVFIGGFFWYTQIREPSSDLLAFSDSQERFLGREFLTMVDKIRSIELDSEFLNSEEFKFLKDLTPAIVLPQVIGRDNPFLPIQ